MCSYVSFVSGGVHDMRAHEWKNFFLDSGIPDHAAAEYATIFVKERINWHILKNLDKGYLTDMGINCIGDQIAILQAAKKYCGEQYAPGHPKAAAAVPHQPAPRMDVEEVHGTSNGASAAHVALNRAPEVPEVTWFFWEVSAVADGEFFRCPSVESRGDEHHFSALPKETRTGSDIR